MYNTVIVMLCSIEVCLAKSLIGKALFPRYSCSVVVVLYCQTNETIILVHV